jgi:hypothetical protein
MSTVELLVIGASAELLGRWRDLAQTQQATLRDFDRVDTALSHAFQRAGLNVIRRAT